MKLLRRGLLIVFLGSIAGQLVAQVTERLEKSETIELALEYNYDIKVAKNNATQAYNNASIYNSGYLPV